MKSANAKDDRIRKSEFISKDILKNSVESVTIVIMESAELFENQSGE